MRSPHSVPPARPRRGHHRSRLLAAPLALLALLPLGCDEAAAPAGVAAAVEVPVVIDRDASGTVTAADSGVVGLSLRLEPLDGAASAPRTATTGANGLARFDAVPPGAYRLVLPDAAPEGTVVTTSPEPRVTVSASGAVNAEPVLYAWLPASISGRIFRDDNNNGVFDDGDTPGAGLLVRLRAEGGAALDSTQTEADGRFLFRFRTPSRYTIELENPGSITYVGDGATRSIDVAAGATATIDAVFTGALVVPIADARARTSGIVAISGALTARPGQLSTGAGSEIWVQDATGGIAVFSVPSADSAQYAFGDVLEVTGTVSTFSGQKQLSSPSVRRLSAGPAPTPVVQTVDQANARTREGQLVRLNNLTVTAVGGGTGAAFNVTVEDAGGATLIIRVSSARAGLSRATFTVGDRYDFIGILTQFNGTAQIKLRSSDDVIAGVPLTPIATARGLSNGTVVTVGGRLTAIPGQITSGSGQVNSELWVQDATGGIAVFSVPSADSATYQLGNTVEVTGTLGAFSQQLQLGTPTVVRTGAGSPVTPLAQTGAQVNALTAEGQLVTVTGFTVTTIAGGTASAFTVTGTTPDGQTIQVRVGGSLAGITRAAFTVGSSYQITGVLTRFNATAQIKPRTLNDIVP